MTNADKFKSVFGVYATELWSMSEKNFLKWLNSEVMKCSEIPNNSDTISRQEAIDALNEYFVRIGKLKRRGLTKGEKAISLDTVGTIKSLPSAQPEIIRCKDCKHYALEVGDDSYALGYCPFIGSHLVMSKGFCAWGERRGEEDDSN